MSDAEQLAYKARALAQSHPLTPLAKRFIDRAVAGEHEAQPLHEIGTWAGAGLTVGYCLRRVEEDEAGLEMAAQEGVDLDLDELDRHTLRIGTELRTDGSPATQFLVDDGEVVAALDRIIASEVSRRLDNWRHSVDEAAWAEMEDYITWWVIKGYALRTAEMAAGAVA